jgi:DNA-binding NarL/FixJ family response regulator
VQELPLAVVVVAPYPSVRAGLRAMVERSDTVQVIAESASGEIPAHIEPDAFIIDVDPEQPSLASRLIDRYPDASLLLLLDSAESYEQLPGAPFERAVGVLLKDAGADEIGAALQAATQGLVVVDPEIARLYLTPTRIAPRPDDLADGIEPLTERERQVLELLAAGLPNKTIAMELGISEHTAKFHVGAIMSKLGAASRTEAVTIAARRGVLVL